MDDRFDRRELLLHLADILEASSRLGKGDALDTPVLQRVQEDGSLREFEFLLTLTPTMTAREFSARTASAFFSWPRALLETELNRDALAATVREHLFDGNPDGWNLYLLQVQKKVGWFGVGVPEGERRVSPEANEDVGQGPPSAKPGDKAPSEARQGQPSQNRKRGWPWPEPGSAS